MGCAINHPLGSITLLNLIVLVEHGLHLVLLHALLHQIERPRDVALGQQVEVVIGEEIPHNEQADEKEQDVAHQAHFFVWKKNLFLISLRTKETKPKNRDINVEALTCHVGIAAPRVFVERIRNEYTRGEEEGHK